MAGSSILTQLHFKAGFAYYYRIASLLIEVTEFSVGSCITLPRFADCAPVFIAMMLLTSLMDTKLSTVASNDLTVYESNIGHKFE